MRLLIHRIWPNPKHTILSRDIMGETFFVINKINIWQPDFWRKVSINVQWAIEIVKSKSWIFPSLTKIDGLLWVINFYTRSLARSRARPISSNSLTDPFQLVIHVNFGNCVYVGHVYADFNINRCISSKIWSQSNIIIIHRQYTI